ncbi:hypothetical protein [Novosphingobium sp. MD-1]|uniref:hypothetical protein n=1 Tax=Novosphingobium sp. MD-1 TaxID=1630648 RepID=UPI000F7F0EC7|nr:hypothetical protein [Novosphingobium sp. MD-1]
MSQALFGRLMASAEQAGTPIDAPDKGRWIKKRDDADIAVMAKAESQSLVLGRHSRTLMVSLDESRYYLMAGFRLSIAVVDGFELCDLTPGLFALAVLELDLDPVASAATIRDALEGRYNGVAGYNGHDLEEISNLFPDILCFRADNNFSFTEDIVRSVGSYLAHTYEHGALPISKETRNSLARIFETGNKHLPYALILQGMLSFSWQSFYLEVYRCIENMYPLSRLKRLSSSFPTNIPLRDLAILLEKELAWRPREEEALAAILRECSSSTLKALHAAMCATSPPNDLHAASAKLVYSTRNELVHFRPRLPTLAKDDDTWDAQVRALVDCLDEIYGACGDVFHELQVN